MDARDYALLSRIANGERVFKPEGEEQPSSEEWIERVERLLRLRTKALIRMPDPPKSFRTSRGVYMLAGPCDVTMDGRDLLERRAPP